MDSVVNAIHIVLSIFAMIGLGVFLTHIGWLNEGNASLISRLVVQVALPAMIISNLFSQFSRESLLASVSGILAPFLSLLATLLLGLAISRLLKLPKGRRGVFTCMFTFSNSVFIGVPVAKALFGDGAIPYTLLYYIANTSIFWSVGHMLLQKDGSIPGPRKEFGRVPAYLAARMKGRAAKTAPEYEGARAALKALHKVIPNPLIVFAACVVLVLVDFQPPRFIMSAAGYVGNLVTPLSLFYSGFVIMRMIRKRAIRWQRGYLLVLVGRFVAAPMLFLASKMLFPMPELMRNVLLVQAAMPVMSQTPIVAADCGADEEYAAGGIALTTALSLVCIPFYMYVIENFLA